MCTILNFLLDLCGNLVLTLYRLLYYIIILVYINSSINYF